MNKYLIACLTCGRLTSRKYAHAHHGGCKRCAEPDALPRNVPSRNQRIIESGYQAYAIEEGHYDNYQE